MHSRYREIRVERHGGGKISLPLHVYVWLIMNGRWEKGETTTPAGHEIHHRDFNPFNNDPSNLELLTATEHRQLHWEKDQEKRLAQIKKMQTDMTPEKKAEAQRKRTESMKLYYASLTPEERSAKMNVIRAHHQRLTEDDVREIRRLYVRGARGEVGKLCTRWGISRQHLRAVATGRLFPNVR
jgi:hypothetical protein